MMLVVLPNHHGERRHASSSMLIRLSAGVKRDRRTRHHVLRWHKIEQSRGGSVGKESFQGEVELVRVGRQLLEVKRSSC